MSCYNLLYTEPVDVHSVHMVPESQTLRALDVYHRTDEPSRLVGLDLRCLDVQIVALDVAFRVIKRWTGRQALGATVPTNPLVAYGIKMSNSINNARITMSHNGL